MTNKPSNNPSINPSRLLQDSLGGSASTALIATVGPAAVNYSETLSTLLFATRCVFGGGVGVCVLGGSHFLKSSSHHLPSVH